MNRLNPNRLKEIRLMRNLTLEQVAAELGISKQAVSKYEKGLSQPAPSAIDKMLTIYEIPRGYLTKKDISVDLIQSPLFFRTKKSTKQIEKDTAANYIKWIYELLAEANREQIKSQVNLPTYTDSMSIEEKALELRKDWGLELGAIDNLALVMESNGINILALDASQAICDAYSQVIDNIPIVIINRNVGSAVRWRFNLAHELGHLILHANTNLDLDIDFDKIEKEANLFAENFLMPEISFGKCIISDKLDYFVALKRDWKVSIAAMIYRCGRLQLIDHNRMIQLQKQLSKRGWKLNEPLDNELEYEVPQRISLQVKSIIADKISADEFLTRVCLPILDIQKILGLSNEYFKNMGISNMQYIKQSEYQQLSMF